jgi:2-oxo-4-hydroxy-4-carboxy--5-ureidoimidazoline (OHCU) decarboxylase
MFERFTDRARRVVVLAQEEARMLKSQPHRHRAHPARPESAIDAQDFERAGSLRDRERQLLADKTARQQEWETAHPDLASLAEQVQRLSGEVERLRGLLRQHGIDPEGKTA